MAAIVVPLIPAVVSGSVDNTIFYSFSVTASTVQPINFNLTGISCAGSMQMAIVATNCTGSALASKCSITSSADQLIAPPLPTETIY